MAKNKVTMTKQQAVKPEVPPLIEPYTVAKEFKRIARELEETNVDQIVVWQSSAKWWKMCQNSALIYAYHVAPELGKNVIIHIDTDRFYNAPDGTVSIADIEKLTKDLDRIGIKLHEDSTESIKIFSLKEPLTKERIDDFRSEERGRRDKLNKILAGKNFYPFINSEARKLLSVIYHSVRKLDAQRYDFIGKKLQDHALELFVCVTRMDRQEMLPIESLNGIIEHSSRMLTYMAVVHELGFLDVQKIEGIAKHLYNIKSDATRAVTELEKLIEREEEIASKQK